MESKAVSKEGRNNIKPSIESQSGRCVMLKLKSLIIGLAMVLAIAQVGYCVNVPVTMQIQDNPPEITVAIYKLTTAGQSPYTGTLVTSMDFGQLTHIRDNGTDAGQWFSKNYFTALIYTNSFGKKFQIRSSCSGLISGANSLPTGSFSLTPDYQALDQWDGTNPATAQGARPSGSILGTVGSAVATNKIIYQSETAATNRILRATYSLPVYNADGSAPFTGYAPILLSQAPGTYTGTVVITIAAY